MSGTATFIRERFAKEKCPGENGVAATTLRALKEMEV
jgi:hypothetical protein